METGSPSCSLNHNLVQTEYFEKHEAPFVSEAVEGRMHRPRMSKIQYLNKLILMAEDQKSSGRCEKQSVDNWSVDEPLSVESKSEAVAKVHAKARRVEIGNGVPNFVHVRAYSKGNLGERYVVTDKSLKQSVGNNPSQLDFRFAESNSKSDNEIRKCEAKKCDSLLPTMEAKKHNIHVGDAQYTRIMETGSPSCSLNHNLVQTEYFEKHEAPFVLEAVEGRMHRPRMSNMQYLNKLILMAEDQKSGGRCEKQSVDNWSVDEPLSVESKSEAVARVHAKARRVEIGNGVPNFVHVRAYSKGNLGERYVVTDKSLKQSAGNNPSQLDFRFAESSSKSDNEIRKCEAKKCDSRLPTMEAKKYNIHVGDARAKVQKARSLFRSVFKALMSEENEGNSGNVNGKKIKRFDLKSAEILKRDNYWVNSGMPIVGTVPGVEVGDEYHYRVELAIVGLHRHYESGIDYVNEDGRILATSIVASGVYADYMYNSDVLVYCGQGGNPRREQDNKISNDQKLERGNLALKNSMLAKRPVRVIRGFNEAKGHQTLLARLETDATLVYDGLYMVERFWEEKGAQRNIIFKYQLRRITGQPAIKLFKTMNRRNFLCEHGCQI